MTMMRSLASILLLSSTVLGHNELEFPPPFRSKHNQFATTVDYDNMAPIKAPGLPCKGYQVDLGTPSGASVVTWTQGSSVSFTLADQTFHNGGSCQVALSTDKGKTWYVIHTWQGGCPLSDGPFNFEIPSDTPTGPALFGWNWINHTGYREHYTNCASITIAAGSGASPKIPFTSRPDLYVVNLDNGCVGVGEKDILIPNPGPDVTNAGTELVPAVGTCQPVNGIGGRTSPGSSGSLGSNSNGPSSSQVGYPTTPSSPHDGHSGVTSSPQVGHPATSSSSRDSHPGVTSSSQGRHPTVTSERRLPFKGRMRCPILCFLYVFSTIPFLWRLRKSTGQFGNLTLTNLRYFLAIFLFSSTALGHMEMTWPPAFRSQYNPYATAARVVDYEQKSPLTNTNSSQLPCKGFQVDMGTPAGASGVTWNQGGNYNLTLFAGIAHGGGSCQVGLSYDIGKTWYVIHTYQGGCPVGSGNLNFDIPSDAPTGTAVFGWLWYNNVGNREIYMSCASVTIAKGSGPAPKLAFKSRPDLFIANMENGCKTTEKVDPIIPNPGPDVTTNNSGPAGPIVGTCAPVNGIGGRVSSESAGSAGSAGSEVNSAASQASSPASPMSAQVFPTSSATSAGGDVGAGGYFITAPPSSTTGLAAATITSVVSVTDQSSSSPVEYSSQATPGDPSAADSTLSPQPTASGSSGSVSSVSITKDGQCSGSQTCAGQSYWGPCCSQWGYCGNDAAHCGAGCQPAFGSCGLNSTNTNATATREYRRVRHFNS